MLYDIDFSENNYEIVSHFLEQNITDDLNQRKIAAVWLGSMALGGLAGYTIADGITRLPGIEDFVEDHGYDLDEFSENLKGTGAFAGMIVGYTSSTFVLLNELTNPNIIANNYLSHRLRGIKPLPKGTVLAVYGTLRKGEGLYNGLIKHSNVDFLGQDNLSGYIMYDIGCPAIVPSNNPEDQVVVELYKFNEKQALNQIDMIELGAGYKRQKINMISDKGEEIECIVYASNHKNLSHCSVIPDGDWVKYNSSMCDQLGKRFKVLKERHNRDKLLKECVISDIN